MLAGSSGPRPEASEEGPLAVGGRAPGWPIPGTGSRGLPTPIAAAPYCKLFRKAACSPPELVVQDSEKDVQMLTESDLQSLDQNLHAGGCRRRPRQSA